MVLFCIYQPRYQVPITILHAKTPTQPQNHTDIGETPRNPTEVGHATILHAETPLSARSRTFFPAVNTTLDTLSTLFPIEKKCFTKWLKVCKLGIHPTRESIPQSQTKHPKPSKNHPRLGGLSFADLAVDVNILLLPVMPLQEVIHRRTLHAEHLADAFHRHPTHAHLRHFGNHLLADLRNTFFVCLRHERILSPYRYTVNPLVHTPE